MLKRKYAVLLLSGLMVGFAFAAPKEISQSTTHFNTAEKIHFTKGEILPLHVKLNISGNLVNWHQSLLMNLKMKQDGYLKIAGENISYSLDGIHYHPFKQMLKGKLTAGIGISDDKPAEKYIGNLNLTVNTKSLS